MRLLAVLLALALPATTASVWTSRCVANTCTFDATKSTGVISGYQWTVRHGKDSVVIGATPVLTYAFPVSGTDSVRGAVQDAATKRWYFATKSITHSGPAAPVVPRVDTVVKYVHDTVYKCPLVVTPPPAPTPTPVPTPTPKPTPAPSGETLAELPRVYLTTTAPAVDGRVIRVTTAAELTAALTVANFGDAIELANGATFVGNFALTNRGADNGKWITLRPADRSQLPPEGTRMTPTLAAAARLPIVQTPNYLGAFNTQLGAHHFRLIGLEISLTPTATANTGLLRLGDAGGAGQTSLAVTPHDLVVDRSYVHGTAGQTTRRGIAANSAATAVIDSWISEIHEVGSDAQAIAGWNGPGPFKFVNNHLEAASENISFGGSDPDVQGLVPSDIEIRHNYITHPIAYKGTGPVKNLIESKNAQRVLVEGNVFEYHFADAQSGSFANVKSTNQGGACPWCGTQDWTFRYNIIRNVSAGFNISSTPDPNPAVRLQRLTIRDNVMTVIDQGVYAGGGWAFQIQQDPIDVVIAHNTVISPTTFAVAFGGGGVPTRLVFRDNIVGSGVYGLKGPGMASGTVTLNAFVTSFVGNVVPGAAGTYPTLNWYPKDAASVGFLNLAGGDLHLSASSLFAGKATDGKNPGADIDAVLAATAGVIVP